MQARPDREAVIQISADESLSVYLKAGTTIVSTAGQLHLTGTPQLLGGQVFRSQTRLAEGEALQLECSGWVTLTAARGGSTLTICHAEAPSQLRDLLHKAASLFAPGRTARTCA
ncbi:MAG: hypothetical protein V4573_18610 [Pseudomonadota bacterium]